MDKLGSHPLFLFTIPTAAIVFYPAWQGWLKDDPEPSAPTQNSTDQLAPEVRTTLVVAWLPPAFSLLRCSAHRSPPQSIACIP